MTQSARPGRWGLVLRIAVTVSILGYLAFKVDWTSLVSQLARADYRWLLLACILFGVTYALAAVRWWYLLRVHAIELPLRLVAALTLVGQFFNTFMLGTVGGDIVKAVYVQKYVPHRRTHATLSIVMDRVLGLFVLICGSLIAILLQLRPMLATPSMQQTVVGLLVVFGAMVVGALLLAVLPFHRAPVMLRRLWQRLPHHRVAELIVSGFRQHGVARRQALASVAAAIVLTLVLILAAYCIAMAIQMQVTYGQLLVIVTVAICVISLPISIGGHGVREGIFALMFAAFGVLTVGESTGAGKASAILFSLLFFALPLVWSLAGGVVYLVFRHDYAQVAAETAE
jgi:uncharacterized protein (TIRG00374 family)